MFEDVFDAEKVKWPTVSRFALGGLGLGAGAASTLALLHMLQQARKDARKAKELKTNENTIVLTLPKKQASAESSAAAEKDTLKAISSTRRSTEVKSPSTSRAVKTEFTTVTEHKVKTGKGQLRHIDGRYGNKAASEKQANWQTLTLAVLAGLGGGAGGYAIIDRLYHNRRMKDKMREVEEARNEYLDQLRSKEAADKSSFNVIDYPLAMAALALILGGGATAYGTKKLLDIHSDDIEDSGRDRFKPQVKRIVFKTAEAGDDFDEDTEAEKIAAVIGIMLDICSGRPDILGDDAVQKSAAAAGIDIGSIYKMASYEEDYSSLLATLEGNPDFRNLIQRVAAEKHPVLRHAKWLLKMPIIKGMADKKLYSAVHENLGPQSALPKQAAVIASLPKMLGASVAGSSIAGVLGDDTDTVQDEEDEEERARRVLSQLTIAAEDPESAKFIEQNEEKLKRLLQVMAASGQL